MTKKAPEETRRKLLDATVRLLAHEGATQLTLAAVAQEAGVSKGGLLHHFPTKQALLADGLSEWFDLVWQEHFEAELAREPEDVPGRKSRAYIRASFDRTDDEKMLVAALTRVIAAYPNWFVGPSGIFNEGWSLAEDDGLPGARAQLIKVSCDGLWLSEIAGMPLIPEAMQQQLREELLRLSYVE